MTATRIHQPVRENRVLNRQQRYDAIAWNDEKAAIAGFKGQIQDFYLAPTKRLLENEDGLFMAVVLTCILIDTLAQYEAGEKHSDRNLFMDWLRKYIPDSAKPLPKRIETSNTREGIQDYAAAIYHGYRCGLLHEAHPYMFCGIAGQYRAIKSQDEIFKCHLNGLTEYEDGTPCPTVTVDPVKFLNAVMQRFDAYFKLLENDNAESRALMVKFKKKFLWSHGINIGMDTK
jgi:hypothetical protein